MPKIFNPARVDEAAAFIAGELKSMLDRTNLDSPLHRRVREACPVFSQGLTNGETVAATLKALNLAALDVFSDLTSLTRDPTFSEEFGDCEEDEDEQALANNPAMPPTDAAPPAPL